MKRDYIYYNTDDFLKDNHFLAWMRNTDPSVNAFWEEWQNEHPEKISSVAEARERYHLLTSFTHVKPHEDDYEEVWEGIENCLKDHKQYSRRKLSRLRILRWSAVAVIALLMIGGWLVYQQIHTPEESFVIVKAGNKTRQIILADSSLIVLNANAILKYHPDNARELWLNGEAFFNVKHHSPAYNASHPFTVHAGAEDIAVLGTVFTVKTAQDAARVVLLRGKVKTSVGNDVVLMKPGEKVEWSHGSFSTEQVAAQLYMAWKDGEFHFDHTSLKELKELVKDVYGYNFVVRNKSSLHNKTISGIVSTKDEETLWKTISLMFNAHVEKNGKQIILTIQ